MKDDVLERLELHRNDQLWDPIRRNGVRGLMRKAWCWPRDPALQEIARSLGATAPGDPEPGQVGLLAIQSDALVGSFWILTHGDSESRGSVPFTGEAARSLQQAWWLASRDLPALQRLDRAQSLVTWRAVPLHATQTRLLDGPSFGLAMCLGVASLLLNLPVEGKYCATATISPSGELGRVDGLAAKIEVLKRDALGVRCLLVARRQQDEAETLLKEAGLLDTTGQHGIKVIAVTHLSDAFEEVFQPERIRQALLDAWKNLEQAQRASRMWFRAAIESSIRLLDWKAFAATAKELHELLERQAQEQASTDLKIAALQTWIARQIALRHSGEHAPIPWSDEPTSGPSVSTAWLGSLRRPVRLEVLAHVVQASADADDEVVSVVPKALKLVAPSQDRTAEDLKLMGACGRALASVGKLEAARKTLQEAVEGWFGIEQPHQSTHALSEWLRLLGVCKEKESLVKALSVYVVEVAADPRLESGALAYVRLAAGRALVQVGLFKEGLNQLQGEDVHWERMREELQLARLRWLGRAYTGDHDEQRAKICRDWLKNLAPTNVQTRLSQLDTALETNNQEIILQALDRLCQAHSVHESWQLEVRRLQRSNLQGIPLAQHLAEQYRY